MVSAEEIFQVQTQDIVRLLSPGSRHDSNQEDDDEIEHLDDTSEVKDEL